MLKAPNSDATGPLIATASISTTKYNVIVLVLLTTVVPKARYDGISEMTSPVALCTLKAATRTEPRTHLGAQGVDKPPRSHPFFVSLPLLYLFVSYLSCGLRMHF